MQRHIITVGFFTICTTMSAAAATECSAKKSHYDQMSTGMSYAAAVKLIGCEGEEMSSAEFGDVKTVMYMWSGSSLGGNMNAMFQNDAMMSKAQFGLK
jgi:hypothetical protein